ncbi:class I SAM-dependent methyltransferase [Arcobacter sp.]|uniref:class I SAM-dependent methyltransferase n=1 Tax=Arcobacter sp. TaxID=1872629 RepID=UPI003D0A102E
MNKVHQNINKYYTDKINQYGVTPKGVDWNSEESQFIRFDQLSKVITCTGFSINDIGCGYGKYTDYLESKFKDFSYVGYDLSEDMIISAQKKYPHYKFIKTNIQDEIQVSDYSIASGIFSVKMQHLEYEWLSYILSTLENLNNKSKKGFSFNMLTKYSDKEYMRNDLYYADPLFIFDYCKRNFSKDIALLHDYNLYEFTVIVRKAY